MKNIQYRGVVVPMVTPVTQEGSLDVEAAEKIVCFFAKAGVAPLLMGTTGEGNSVSRADGATLVQTAVKAAAGRVLVYAGLTGNCFEEQLSQADTYDKAGADVVVATLPSYYALTEAQMEHYYARLADGVARPLMLYNILATTHMSIPVEVVRRLAEHPNIVGLKDSERDLDRMEACLQVARERDDFAYFCGWAAQSAHALSIGADGIVPSTGNFVPGMFQRLYRAAASGDQATAMRLQGETDTIAQVYQKGRSLGQSLAALKVMMGLRKLCQPWMLMPLTRLADDEENLVARQASAYLNLD